MSSDNILVTGFGPFGEHKINASWESVKLLPKQIKGYNVITEEIPVCYETVDKKVQELWKQYNPKLVVHVGVSTIASNITLETCARRSGYERSDCYGNFLETKQCPVGGEPCIHTTLDVAEIEQHVNGTNATKTVTSCDAGRYLCEYTYYTSLSIDKDRSLFIHVPPLDQPYSAEELAKGITAVIERALLLLKNCIN